MYFDSKTPSNYEGFYGCPQCASVSCVPCAGEVSGICTCGGELIHNQWYEYSGDDRLPDEIAQHQTEARRVQALDELRKIRPMIQAEYNHLKGLIECCTKFKKSGQPMPRNIGLARLQQYPDYFSPIMVNSYVWLSALPDDIDQMLELADSRALECIERNVADYPTNDAEWQDWAAEDQFSGYGSTIPIPFRSPEEQLAQRKWIVNLIRDALQRRPKRPSPPPSPDDHLDLLDFEQS